MEWPSVRAGLVGVLACVLAWMLGGALVAAAAAAAAYGVSSLASRRIAALLLLGAPMVLASGMPAQDLVSWSTLPALAVAVLAVTPVFLHLGGAVPWRQAWLFAAVPFVVAGVVWVAATPDLRMALLMSDASARLQIALLLVGAAMADGLASVGRRRSSSVEADAVQA